MDWVVATSSSSGTLCGLLEMRFQLGCVVAWLRCLESEFDDGDEKEEEVAEALGFWDGWFRIIFFVTLSSQNSRFLFFFSSCDTTVTNENWKYQIAPGYGLFNYFAAVQQRFITPRLTQVHNTIPLTLAVVVLTAVSVSVATATSTIGTHILRCTPTLFLFISNSSHFNSPSLIEQ